MSREGRGSQSLTGEPVPPGQWTTPGRAGHAEANGDAGSAGHTRQGRPCRGQQGCGTRRETAANRQVILEKGQLSGCSGHGQLSHGFSGVLVRVKGPEIPEPRWETEAQRVAGHTQTFCVWWRCTTIPNPAGQSRKWTLHRLCEDSRDTRLQGSQPLSRNQSVCGLLAGAPCSRTLTHMTAPHSRRQAALLGPGHLAGKAQGWVRHTDQTAWPASAPHHLQGWTLLVPSVGGQEACAGVLQLHDKRPHTTVYPSTVLATRVQNQGVGGSHSLQGFRGCSWPLPASSVPNTASVTTSILWFLFVQTKDTCDCISGSPGSPRDRLIPRA